MFRSELIRRRERSGPNRRFGLTVMLGLLVSVQASTGSRHATAEDLNVDPWWETRVSEAVLDAHQWVRFDLPTILADTLMHSPRVTSIKNRTSIAYERIVQQDAAFDPSVLLQSGLGRVNDPVGNSLTVGNGGDRLIQENLSARAGVRQLTRSGTQVDIGQELGTLNSNSQFFLPQDQGNSRLSLSVTQPLMARGGKLYNTRLVTQASIESRIAWQQMRADLESHLVDTLSTYWRLYERRCHVVQETDLLRRSENVGAMVRARADYDSGPIQIVKVKRRLAEREARRVELQADVLALQVQLKAQIGSDELMQRGDELELIPTGELMMPYETIAVRDAIIRGLENRPDIRSATEQLSAAGLSIAVSRNELKPRLDAVFDAYLAGLNGDNAFFRSFGDQFSTGGPGASATLQYELPYGRRASKSRLREDQYRYRQRAEELRDAMLTARSEIELALIRVEATYQLRINRAATLAASAREEDISTARWQTLAGDGGPMALVLEDLLETQTRRTEAEQAYVSAGVQHMLALVELQRAMGTFLINEEISASRPDSTSRIEISMEQPYVEPIPSNGMIESIPPDDTPWPDDPMELIE